MKVKDDAMHRVKQQATIHFTEGIADPLTKRCIWWSATIAGVSYNVSTHDEPWQDYE
jgi:hypothetical protein